MQSGQSSGWAERGLHSPFAEPLPWGASAPEALAPGPQDPALRPPVIRQLAGLSVGRLFPANYHLMKSVSLRNSAFD